VARHTHAGLLNSQGESVKTIQAQLRHSSARVTMEIHTRAIPQHQREAVARLEQAIGPQWTQIQEGGAEDAPLIHYTFRWKWRGRRDSNSRPPA
jgi:hypothetical protein